MRRSHFHPSHCKVCGISGAAVGGISQQGFCAEHGRQRMEANLAALETGKGPFAAWWAYRLANAVWGLPVDGAPEQP